MGTGAPKGSGREQGVHPVRPASKTPGQDGSRPTPAPASPTPPDEIRASDLAKLMVVVHAAINVFNVAELTSAVTPLNLGLARAVELLGEALDDLGVDKA